MVVLLCGIDAPQVRHSGRPSPCELFDQSFAQILAAVLPAFLPNFLHVSVGQQDLHAASAHEGGGFARKSL